MIGKYTIYYDALHEAEWLADHHGDLAASRFSPILKRGDNPEPIDVLVAYDRPDAILCQADIPILTVEKTKEVPTGHNVGQRMARLVRSLEHGVPCIYKAPFDAMKHGLFSNTCNLNIRLIDAFRKMTLYHGVPIVAVNTAVDAFSEIITENDDRVVAQILRDYLPDRSLVAFDQARTTMDLEYEVRLAKRPAYALPPSSVSVVPTSIFLDSLPYNTASSAKLLSREQSVVYTIGMTPEKCRREDPYTGMTFIYDYTLCRSGPATSDKKRNLILSMPLITCDRWLEANPNDPRKKSSNWYLTASAIALKDGLIYCGDGIQARSEAI